MLLETEERESFGATVSSYITGSWIAYFAVKIGLAIGITRSNVAEKVLAFLVNYAYLAVKHYESKEVEAVEPSNFVEL